MANNNPRSDTKPLGITMGDAAGIGPEIIIKLFADALPAPAVVYGDFGVLSKTASNLGLDTAVRLIPLSSIDEWPDKTGHDHAIPIPVLSRRPALPANLKPGVLHADAGRAAYDYLCHAIDDASAGKLRAIVTAPLNKEAMRAGGLNYPGHTEILAEKTGTRHFGMMLATQNLRVILATIHIPLMQVASHLSTQTQLDTIRLAWQACRHAGITSPRVAVAGLNPHAGEGGQFGAEEQTIIGPAIQQAQHEGIDATGPWPGDTVFMRALKGEFDIVVAQYHDQGLIPVKLLGLEEGVNITVGLPFVRTSVDHGTAFDIAGQGIADPASLRAACVLALDMTQGY